MNLMTVVYKDKLSFYYKILQLMPNNKNSKDIQKVLQVILIWMIKAGNKLQYKQINKNNRIVTMNMKIHIIKAVKINFRQTPNKYSLNRMKNYKMIYRTFKNNKDNNQMNTKTK